MNCNEVEKQLALMGNSLEKTGILELDQHLEACDSCFGYRQELVLCGLLKSLPVPPNMPDFDNRMLGESKYVARGSRYGLHVKWGLATAASMLLAVFLTLRFIPGVLPENPDELQALVIEVVPNQVRTVNVMLNSPRELSGAMLVIELDDNLELEGYAGVHVLQWSTDIKAGDNHLALPVQLLSGQSGKINIVVQHENSRKHMTIIINSAPESAEQTVSLVEAVSV